MRILVISDIHANLVAFETVLKDVDGAWDKIWCLGDVIGYGPRPNECVELLREYDHVCLTGNHDYAALGKISIQNFNSEAQRAVRWTQKMITAETRDYLDAQPPMRLVDNFTLVHASPREPVWEYIQDYETAVANFALIETPICLVGHTHVPMLIAEKAPGDVVGIPPDYNATIYLEDTRVIINPGSIGQPRDSDPRAAYAVLDSEILAWEFHRVEYPIAETQAQMREARLPRPLIRRLEYGW
ncbi:MAG: metallophosphoesterase family protein [Anaerolineales bacterium]|nr:metallophosphoesterase family protein [Anaerolineales bacterium]